MKKICLIAISLIISSTSFAGAEQNCIDKIKEVSISVAEITNQMTNLDAQVNKTKKKNYYSVSVVDAPIEGKFIDGYNVVVDNNKSCVIQKITLFGF